MMKTGHGGRQGGQGQGEGCERLGRARRTETRRGMARLRRARRTGTRRGM